MVCPLKSGEAAELIVSYAARTLDPRAEAAFESHLELCDRCRELAGAQKAVWRALDQLPPLQISSDFDQNVFARIARDQSPWWRQVGWFSWSWRPVLPVAAACAALVVAFLLKTSVQTAPSPHNQSQVQIEQVKHALDDIDMLSQLGFESVANNAPVKPI